MQKTNTKFPVRLKLLLMTVIPLLAIIAVSGYSLYRISVINEKVNSLIHAEDQLIKKITKDAYANNLSVQNTSNQSEINELLGDLKTQGAEVSAFEDSMFMSISMFTLATIFVSLLFNSMISQNLIQSLMAAITFARRVSKGERNISVTHMTNDEMGSLLRMLHDMQMSIVDTENALKANERHLRFITDSLPAQISYIDNKEQHQFCNIKYARSYYQPKNEITGKALKKVIGDTQYSEIKEHVKIALKGHHVSYEQTKEGLHADPQFVSVDYIPDINSDGEVIGFIGVANNITHLKQIQYKLEAKQKELELITKVDPLTGAYNRRSLNEFIDNAIENYKTAQQPLSLMMVDLDHFKTINDNYGHGAGDEVLRITGKILKDNFRDTDFICRYGGEEFCIVLPNTDFKTMQELAERVRHVIEEAHIPITKDKRIDFTCSIGIASYQSNMCNSDALIDEADNALYEAKHAGRNRVISLKSA